MKKPVKKGSDNKSQNLNDGRKDVPDRKETSKKEHSKPETPFEHDAGDQDGSAGIGGTSGI